MCSQTFVCDNYSTILSGKIESYNHIKNTKITKSTVNCSNIENSVINQNSNITHAYIQSSSVGNDCNIGVFSRLRENTKLGTNVKIGNFVETKNSTINSHSKVPHLSYVGDATIGTNVNIGCGTVFCNYNGEIKQRSVVGNNVFVGSNTNLIAPVTVGDNSFIGAGSTITLDIPNNTLAIARSRQINKLNYKL